ncbi:unnamed protein product [Sympodiomycopsis kandeliae]
MFSSTKWLSSAAAALLFSAPTLYAIPIQTTEITQHQYAFNAPVWNPFASSKPHPLVIWHGLGDSGYSDGMEELKETLEQAYPGLFVYLIALGQDAGSDRNRGVFGNVNDDVEQVCQELSVQKELKDGFDAIGFSQGGQFLRALVQRCEKVQVRNLVTFGSQHMGISDLPACSPADIFCRLTEGALRSGVYTEYAQTKIVTAQYFRDPRTQEKLDKYLAANHFLTDINNELEQNDEYKKRLSSLETFVMLQFDKDVTVVPKRSSWFEAYPTESTEEGDVASKGKKEETIPLRQSELYKSDRVGLKTLDKRGSLVLDTCKGAHMQINGACQLKVFGKYVATPKSTLPRRVRDSWARAVYFVTGWHSTGLPWTVHLLMAMVVVMVIELVVVNVAARVSGRLTAKQGQKADGTQEGRIRLP